MFAFVLFIFFFAKFFSTQFGTSQYCARTHFEHFPPILHSTPLLSLCLLLHIRIIAVCLCSLGSDKKH